MLLFFALLMTVSLIALFAGWRLTRSSRSDVHRIELFLSGEAIADHYRPLGRLLHKTDWKYLSAQPGMSQARIRQFRAQRRKLFRQYLSSLISDFGSLCFLVRVLMVQSAVDRPDLHNSLSRIQTTFYKNVVMVHCQLLIHAVGISSVNIEAGELTRAVEALIAQARMLQLSASPSFA
jgi:hypothetical protein